MGIGVKPFLTVVKTTNAWPFVVTKKGQRLCLCLLFSQVIETNVQLGDKFNIFGVVAVTNTVTGCS